MRLFFSFTIPEMYLLHNQTVFTYFTFIVTLFIASVRRRWRRRKKMAMTMRLSQRWAAVAGKGEHRTGKTAAAMTMGPEGNKARARCNGATTQ
jgi:hypothetical protein